MAHGEPCDPTQTHTQQPIKINRSIIQGSGIGPVLFIMFANDLKAIGSMNYILKYADDSSLLCPEKSPVTVEDEMQIVIRWSEQNKLLINMLKTKEMVFHRPNPRLYIEPPAMQNIERVNEFKLLGVYFCSDLRFNACCFSLRRFL